MHVPPSPSQRSMRFAPPRDPHLRHGTSSGAGASSSPSAAATAAAAEGMGVGAGVLLPPDLLVLLEAALAETELASVLGGVFALFLGFECAKEASFSAALGSMVGRRRRSDTSGKTQAP